jgi:hypothetical protein
MLEGPWEAVPSLLAHMFALTAQHNIDTWRSMLLSMAHTWRCPFPLLRYPASKRYSRSSPLYDEHDDEEYVMNTMCRS